MALITLAKYETWKHRLEKQLFNAGLASLDCKPQPVKMDLNKKTLPKQKTTQSITIDTLQFRKPINDAGGIQISFFSIILSHKVTFCHLLVQL